MHDHTVLFQAFVFAQLNEVVDFNCVCKMVDNSTVEPLLTDTPIKRTPY